MGQGLGIAHRHDHTCLPVAHCLGQAARIGSHNGRAASLRFDSHDALPLLQAGHTDDIRHPVGIQHSLVVESTQEIDRFRQAQLFEFSGAFHFPVDRFPPVPAAVRYALHELKRTPR